jgi:hypothetical protein
MKTKTRASGWSFWEWLLGGGTGNGGGTAG